MLAPIVLFVYKRPNRTKLIIDKLSEEFEDRITGVSLSESVGNRKVTGGSKYANVALTGLNKVALDSSELTMLGGRGFYDSDYTDARKVCLVSDYFCDNLYKGKAADALEKKVRVKIGNKLYDYVIVGVYKYDANQAMFSTSKYDTSTNLYIPLAAALDETHNKKGYSQITVVAKETGDVTRLSNEIEEYMNEKFYRNNNNYEVSCFATQSLIESYNKSMGIISVAISVIASISLLVGGVGVMNIMLVSITERTKEIGTRKALGATNASIRMQFVIEAIVLCGTGGILGVIVGLLVGMVAAKYMGYAGAASMGSIVFSLIFSMAIGVFFGYYPANKAAKMNPIDALRYE